MLGVSNLLDVLELIPNLKRGYICFFYVCMYSWLYAEEFLKIMLRIHFMVKVKWKLKNVLKRRILNILGLLYVLRLFGDHGLENLMISSFRIVLNRMYFHG